eukprot:COSAG05_NODE_18063_length_314_cov_1.190698_1_plen_52_part_01
MRNHVACQPRQAVISPFLGSPAQQIEAADAKAIGLDKLGTAMRPHVTMLKVS